MNKSIVQAIDDKDYSHEWMRVVINQGSDELVLLMSYDSLKDDEGVRLSCSPKEMQECCERLNALPSTPFLLDHRFDQSCIKNEPQPKYYPGGVGMSETLAVAEHSHRVDLVVGGQTGSVGVPGKFWVAPLAVENLYGGHVITHESTWKGIKMYPCVSGLEGLKVFQARSSAHTGFNDLEVEGTHEDYMMGLVVVFRQGELNGVEVDVKTLYDEGSSLVWGTEQFSGSIVASAPILIKGSPHTAWVKSWQARLISLGISLAPYGADGDFGTLTEDKTELIQKIYGLPETGIVTHLEWEATETPFERKTVPLATFKPLTRDQKQDKFGYIAFKHSPLDINPEHIVITNGWTQDHIIGVKIPQLKSLGYPTAYVHKLIAKQLKDFFQALEDEELLHYIKTCEGFWVPRLVRGRNYLSSHAHGTAFDINYRWNQLGANPADWYEEGTVKPLVTVAEHYGFYWGGRFSRSDGNHFEAAILKG